MSTVTDAARVRSATSTTRPGSTGSSQSVSALPTDARAPSSSPSLPPESAAGTAASAALSFAACRLAFRRAASLLSFALLAAAAFFLAFSASVGPDDGAVGV